MQLERKALYNALRLSWVRDPAMPVKKWQVRDFRAIPSDELYQMLEELDLPLTQRGFLLHAQEVGSPEELAELLSSDDESDPEVDDQRYLVLFELWRRLLPEQQSLSIFCDRLDHEIDCYDQEELESAVRMQDLLADLQEVLDENVDEGTDPHLVMETLSRHCANDVESFLYDYISERLDEGNVAYGSELIEGFCPYLTDRRWVDLLNARVALLTDPERVDALVRQAASAIGESPDLDLTLELLEVVGRCSNPALFLQVMRSALSLLQEEGDFVDLLEICADYCSRQDRAEQEEKILALLDERRGRHVEAPWGPTDGAAHRLVQILER
jgi:hypothetical protein